MNYENLSELVADMREFCKSNECYIQVKDIPKELKMGFEAITDGGNGNKEWTIRLMAFRKDCDTVFSKTENDMIANFFAKRVEFNNAEKEYLNVFSQIQQ